VEISPARQRVGIDFHHRADDHELPIGSRLRDAADQVHIEAFVDHAGEADARPPDDGLIVRFGLLRPRFDKMRDIDAARKRMDVRVPGSLVFVQAHAAGEDDVRHSEQLLFERRQLRGCRFELRELVHAVVDHRRWYEMARKLDRHRRVIPAYETAAHLASDIIVEQFPHLRVRFSAVQSMRQARHDEAYAFAALCHVQVSADTVGKARLLYEVHGSMSRATRHEMLRALEHEVPAQVREDEQVWRSCSGSSHGRRWLQLPYHPASWRPRWGCASRGTSVAL